MHMPVRHKGGLTQPEDPNHDNRDGRLSLGDFSRIFPGAATYEPAPLSEARPTHAFCLAGELDKLAELELQQRERTGKPPQGALPFSPPIRPTHHHPLSHSFLAQVVFQPSTGGIFASRRPTSTRGSPSRLAHQRARQPPPCLDPVRSTGSAACLYARFIRLSCFVSLSGVR